MIIFFDRNTGVAIPKALGELRVPVEIEYHQKHFRDNIPDDSWLQQVGFYGWFVITQDYKFHLPGFKSELDAIRNYEIGCFYLWGANQPTWEVMRTFARAYDRIVKAAETTQRPFIYRIQRNGQLRRIKIPE